MLVHRMTFPTARQQLRHYRPKFFTQPCSFFSSSVRSHEEESDDSNNEVPHPHHHHHDHHHPVVGGVDATKKKKDAFGGSSYQWDDPLRLRSQLNDEELTVWDTARAFCDSELMPGIVEANRHEIPCDKTMMKKMGTITYRVRLLDLSSSYYCTSRLRPSSSFPLLYFTNL